MNREQNDKRVMEFFNLIPPSWDVVIAGGAAVGLGKEGDVDLWLLGRDRLDNLDKDKLNTALHELLPKNGGYEFTENGSAEYAATMGNDGFLKIAEGTYKGKKFQIFTTPWNVKELLARFDLSCVQIAILRSGVIYKGLSYTEPSDPIKITNFATPVSTFDRAIKHAARNGSSIRSGLDLQFLFDEGVSRLEAKERQLTNDRAAVELNLDEFNEVPF